MEENIKCLIITELNKVIVQTQGNSYKYQLIDRKEELLDLFENREKFINKVNDFLIETKDLGKISKEERLVDKELLKYLTRKLNNEINNNTYIPLNNDEKCIMEYKMILNWVFNNYFTKKRPFNLTRAYTKKIVS